MRINFYPRELVGFAVVGLFLVFITPPVGSKGLDSIQIVGTIGLAHAEESSCIAVWIPVDEKMAISGIKWYNNDGSMAFSEALVQSGTAEYPVSLADAFQVAENFHGVSLGWSELVFSEPVACSSEGLYVILRVPDGALATSAGLGGGPAIGYTSAKSGYPGWMSANGEDWVQVHPDFGFAISPVFVDRAEGMFTKSSLLSCDGPADDQAQLGEVVATLMKPAAPNPFNPQTTIHFSLREDCRVDLCVYNIKGELVKQLLAQNMSSGEHSVVWNGRGKNGSTLASGVYLARFVAGEVVMTQRLVLVQ